MTPLVCTLGMAMLDHLGITNIRGVMFVILLLIPQNLQFHWGSQQNWASERYDQKPSDSSET